MATYGSLPSSAFKGPLILPRPSNSAVPLRSLGPMSSSSSSSPAAAAGRSRALKVHSQAEKRRRERINEHLSTLRRMVPSDTAKMDKAALLGKVIDHVKDLKRKAIDIGKLGNSTPTEADEVIVEPDGTVLENMNFYVKASVCCDDRPDLFMNLMRAFHGLRLRVMRADITSLGGRVKIVFVLCGRDIQGSGNVSLGSFGETLKDALARIASFDTVTMDASTSKRKRLLQSYCSGVSL